MGLLGERVGAQGGIWGTCQSPCAFQIGFNVPRFCYTHVFTTTPSLPPPAYFVIKMSSGCNEIMCWLHSPLQREAPPRILAMLIPKSNYTEMQKPLLPALAQTLHGVGLGSRRMLMQVSQGLRQQTSSCVLSPATVCSLDICTSSHHQLPEGLSQARHWSGHGIVQTLNHP